MSTQLSKFIKTLEEMFQFDQSDLDFGTYRIMNQKREEITRFFNYQLVPQVKQAFEKYRDADINTLKQEMRRLEQQLSDMGVAKESSEKYQSLNERVNKGIDISSLENEVYSDLANFFKRYYHEGDFLSLRRFKKDVYAIPYEGEEVKLHWANADQYYVKSSEYFRDYAFKLPSGKKVHFKIIEAETERNNNKAQKDNERHFILVQDFPVIEENGELYIRFEYKPDEKRRRREKINLDTIDQIFNSSGYYEWVNELKELSPTEKNPQRTLLEKHLNDYTARNTFDYFIHKDLGAFLRRELDFYIKNEIMHLDDIDTDNEKRFEQYLSKVKVIKSIGGKIISFLAQIEDFQKKLWLKKKFVVETNYCITLDKVPEEFYVEIINNKDQVDEWIRLFSIDEIVGDLTSVGYSEPLTIEFLKNNQYLMIDTKFYEKSFKYKLLSHYNNLDSHIDGTLIHSENFQAMNLIHEKYNKQIKCIYVDPPFNTSASEIIYKNSYKHSSWLSMIYDRVKFGKSLLSDNGVFEIAIDDAEFFRLQGVMNQIFKDENHISNIAIMHNPKGREQAFVSDAHEYTLLYANNRDKISLNRLKLSDEELKDKYPKGGKGEKRYRELPLRRRGTAPFREDRPYMYFPFIYNPIDDHVSIIDRDEYEKIYDGSNFDDDYIEDLIAKYKKDGLDLIFPIRQDGRLGRWRWGYDRCKEGCEKDIFFVTGNEAPTIYHKDFANNTVLPKSLWYGERFDASTKGTNILKNIIPGNEFDYPKSIFAVEDFIQIGASSDDLVLDFFAGSGTTGHAVINLNREDSGNRKYILVEMGEYFDSVTKPRIQKVVYSKDWKNGKPVSRLGSSHMFKYIRLESYEDSLNNIELQRTSQQELALQNNMHEGAKEDYFLSYMLDVESEGSATLIDIDEFKDPFNYKLQISNGLESKTQPIDLIETFNYLLGLNINQIDYKRGFQVIDGYLNSGEKALVIWRNLLESENEDLEVFFEEEGYGSLNSNIDKIYVNGDNNLETLKSEKDNWKVILIEKEFKRLMFDSQDV
ncbi:site-specific DNA-methyltransferase [Thalassobacillus pellis]|uniref:site-specific DNA-methyltransferase n=1 Tax=Thalassobacillus pellis TaxID=748008 RepID=UPI0019613A4B|nr:site-specific DNA-methyltransferase [Thalassobacillus pellis]MBM7554812.1 adenine-specific DNA-methyltransferase [Thalassobacillus pellis]